MRVMDDPTPEEKMMLVREFHSREKKYLLPENFYLLVIQMPDAFDLPFDELPLHINDPGGRALIARWRLRIGK